MSQTRRLNSMRSVRQRPGPHKIYDDTHINGLKFVWISALRLVLKQLTMIQTGFHSTIFRYRAQGPVLTKCTVSKTWEDAKP
jgi:hypothetical protein